MGRLIETGQPAVKSLLVVRALLELGRPDAPSCNLSCSPRKSPGVLVYTSLKQYKLS